MEKAMLNTPLHSEHEGIKTNAQLVWNKLKEDKVPKASLIRSLQHRSSCGLTAGQFRKSVNSLVDLASFCAACTGKLYTHSDNQPVFKEIKYVQQPCAEEVYEMVKIGLSPFTVRRALRETLAEALAEKEKYVSFKGDFSRRGKVSMEDAIWGILSLSDKTNYKEVAKLCQRRNLPLISKTAFYYIRKKILPVLFQDIMERFFERMKPYLPKGKYTIYLIDGSEFRYPFNPKEPEAGIKASGGNYNAHMHMTGLLHAISGMFATVRLSQGSKKEEADSLIRILESGKLSIRDLVIDDRLYCSYKVLAAFKENGVQFLIRSKDVKSSNSIFKNKELPSQPTFDTYVTFHLSSRKTKELMRDKDYKFVYRNKFPYYKEGEDFYELKLRVIRYKHNGEYHTLVTSIPMEEMSTEEVIRLYSCRWEIETAFRYLKQACKLEYFHSKSIWLNAQELLARLALYNVAKAITLCVPKIKKGLYDYKVAFTTVFDTIVEFLFEKTTEKFLMDQMKGTMEPERKNRHSLRNKKIRMIPSYNNR